MKPVRQITDDTKGKKEQVQTEVVMGAVTIAAEGPEDMFEKIRQQATHLGPVMEEILRQTHGHGQSHWGLNE
ncbi:MAG TPA: hypothetical protein VMB22_05375 [Verrucomicrobiae bacterium]|nr:hypothetical protein [Verrucomicrobiae bacterium]